jgi:hypothetical protein
MYVCLLLLVKVLTVILIIPKRMLQQEEINLLAHGCSVNIEKLFSMIISIRGLSSSRILFIDINSYFIYIYIL